MEEVKSLTLLPRVCMIKYLEISNEGELLLTVFKGSSGSTKVERYTELRNYWKERLKK